MNNTVLAGGTPPFFTSRIAAMVSASVFDAVNGIDPRYRPIHVRQNAPHGASQRAAAIQAAYVILADAYPAQSAALTAQRNASLGTLALTENAKSIDSGVAWGQTVANAIWAWRQTDGFAPPPPPFEGVLGIVGTPAAIGYWRPTPPPNAPGAGTQLATMTPWVLVRASQFRLQPPYSLDSPQYAADLNETKTMGALSGSPRTADQSELALFWQSNTPLTWNRVAAQTSAERGLSFHENVHLFALLNVTMADAEQFMFFVFKKSAFFFFCPLLVHFLFRRVHPEHSAPTLLFDDEVYVFTPKGEVKTLPPGDPIDFAYAVHTDVGHRPSGPRSTAGSCRCTTS